MKKPGLKKLCLFLLCVFPSGLLALDVKNLEPAPDKTGRIKQLKIKSLSDLRQLTPYEFVSVIQKRYLPKTFRGELNLSFTSLINHTFFYSGGVSAQAGFFIREDHGFGLEGIALLPPAKKWVVKELAENLISVQGGGVPQLYGGVYYKWSPVFGKFAFLNRKIIYFDMYITVGAGVSRMIKSSDDEIERQTSEEEGRSLSNLTENFVSTFNIGGGQVFALNQSWAFNWDLKALWTVIHFQNRSFWPDLNLSFGMNYYFPGARYR